MVKTVEIKCKGFTDIALSNLFHFQGDLKSLSDENYEKLKNQILELGFSEPVSVWINKDKHYLLNGHQRCETLKRMENEGYKIPSVPINIVEADDLKQAKLKVLSWTSTFGIMSNAGLKDF